MGMHQVFNGIIADANSGTFKNTTGQRTLIVVGSGGFSGGTLLVAVSPDDGVTFVSATMSLTDEGIIQGEIPDEATVLLSLVGATTPSVSAWANLPIPPT